MKGTIIEELLITRPYKVFHMNVGRYDYCAVDMLRGEGMGLSHDVLYITDREMGDRPDNVVRVVSPENAEDLLAAVQDLFRTEHRMDLCYRQIVAMNAGTADIQDIMDAIAMMYGRPINMVSSSYEILGYSRSIPFYHPGLYREIENGRVSAEDIRYLNIKTIRATRRIDETIIVVNEREQVYHYQTPVLKDRVTLGYFSVFVRPGESLTSMEISYLPLLASQLSIALQRKDFYILNKDNYYTNLFAAILSGDLADSSEIANRIRAYDFQLMDVNCILSFKIIDQLRTEFVINELVNEIKLILRNAFYITQKEKSYFFATFEDAEAGEAVLEALKDFLRDKAGLAAGCSEYFSDVAEISYHVDESDIALEAGLVYDPDKRIYRIGSYRMKYNAMQLYKCTNGRSTLMHQFKKVLMYDHSRDTELLRTLYYDIRMNGEVSRICDKLHIHRNTLYFRRQKLCEIAELDLYDPSQKSLILLTFYTMFLMGLIDWELD